MKRFVCMALALILICSLALSVHAADTDVGSIEVKVMYENQKITGGSLIAVRVGYVDDAKLVFRKVTNHDEIKNIGDSATVTQMQNFYTSSKKNHTFLTYKAEVKNGVAKFTGLPRGLYLISQDTAASGYKKLSDFLVTVPYGGKMDVTATSKPSLEKKQEKDPTTPTKPASSSSGSSSSSGNKKLPQTGQLTWPIPWMTLGGLTLFVFGWWLCFGKRKDDL